MGSSNPMVSEMALVTLNKAKSPKFGEGTDRQLGLIEVGGRQEMVGGEESATL